MFVLIRIVRFAGWIWTSKAPTSQHLALRNMTSIEHRRLFQLLQNLRLRDAEGLEKRRPDASRLRSCHASENRGGYQTVRPTASCSTPARETSSWSMSACDVSSCNFSKPSCKLQTNGLVRRITMHGHLTCPEIFWHVSDTRIGPISNPVDVYLLRMCLPLVGV